MKEKIRKLLKEKNAILLAHNYQPPEIQDIADLCGDSLELSIKASQTNAEVIVFCGVHFMAETASILCPEKKVLLPKLSAGCPMADMITAEALKAKKAKLPGVPVVTYVNSPAAVKALSTVCCTSANAIQIVSALAEKEVLMAHDKNLARYTAAHTDKIVHLWEGYCPFHNLLSPEMVEKAKAKHPDALFIAHPECRLEILEMADAVKSTSGMLDFVKNSKNHAFIIGTEVGLLYALKKQNPDKNFYPASIQMECADMKKITLADIVKSLETMQPEVKVLPEIQRDALKAVERMIGVKK